VQAASGRYFRRYNILYFGRVALARFWFKQNAKLWILDEPFTALDTQGIELLSKQITAFLSDGGAVVMTSHQALRIDYPTDELTLEYQI
jgi:heme exporter protein A